MKAIILAAGKSSRLYPLTLAKPKCLLPLHGKSIVEWQLKALRGEGIEDIVMIVGYKKEIIQKELGSNARYREYNDFEKTNNLNTLWSVRSELNDSCLCLFSDLLFGPDLLKRVKNAKEDICLAVDTRRVLEGTMRVQIRKGKLCGVGSHIPVSEGSGNFIGMAKFSVKGASVLLGQMEKMLQNNQQDYYTIAVDALAKQGHTIGYVDVRDQSWIEIDTLDDLEKAKRDKLWQ